MRDTTECPEALEIEIVKFVGADFEKIEREVAMLLVNEGTLCEETQRAESLRG